MWTFGTIVVRSHVQLFATLGVFSTIVPSYMIYVKCQYQFLREIDIGTCFWGHEVVSITSLALPYQNMTALFPVQYRATWLIVT